MQPDTSSSTTKSPPRSSALRYALALALLVAAIGGIAWIAQFLPSWNKPKPNVPTPVAATPLLEFPRWIAQWDNQKPSENADDPLAAKKEVNLPKEFEFGTEGHYDFPFKNISGKEVEVVQYVSDCDCTSVRVCALPMAEWTEIAKQQELKPGDPLSYAAEPAPAWQDLQNSRQQAAEPQNVTVLKVKADEGAWSAFAGKSRKRRGSR